MPSWLGRLTARFSPRLGEVWEAVVSPDPAPNADEAIAERARAAAPVVWLLGKVQSGKSSIVRALTGSAEAEVGLGFKPCTRTARVFDFPPEAPVIRFLDTRGLGETGYDPAEDIAVCEGRAQLIIAVMKALDHDQGAILDVVRAARRRHPTWPVAVAQTSLHESYAPGAGHPQPYPFDADGAPAGAAAGVSHELRRSLAAQRGLFETIPGSGAVAFTPLDFTREGDGYEPVNYGLDALIETLRRTAPDGLAASLDAARGEAGGERARRAHPHIVGYAIAAGAADAVPGAGLIAVPGVQAKMLHSLARIYGVRWDRRALAEFAGALGAGTAVKALSAFGIRELIKFIPVYGQTAGAAAAAAASFAMTFALGKAACAFFDRRRSGPVAPGDLKAAYRDALDEAFRLSKARRESGQQEAAS